MQIEMINNILIQILFFPILTVIGSWASVKYILENSDWKQFDKKLEETNGEESTLKLKMMSKYLKIQDGLLKISSVISSWTIDVLRNVILVVVLFLCGHFPKVELKVCDDFDEEEGIDGKAVYKGELYFKVIGNAKRFALLSLFTYPVYISAVCGLRILFMLLPNIFGVVFIASFLPSTFTSVMTGVEQWLSLLSTPLSAEWFTNANSIFVDIVWNRFIIGGINENPTILVAICLYFIIFAGDLYADFIDLDGRVVFGTAMWLIYGTIIVFVMNILSMAISPLNYAVIANTVNSVGMICALFVIVNFALNLIQIAPLFVIKKLIDKAVDKIKSKALSVIK